MGKFRYLSLILILGLTSSLIVYFPVLSQEKYTRRQSDIELAEVELEEICTFKITVKEKELHEILTEFRDACKEYEQLRNILFKQLEGLIKQDEIPTRENLEKVIKYINNQLNKLQSENSYLKDKLKELEKEKLEFHYYLFTTTTLENYEIIQKLKQDKFIYQYLRRIQQRNRLEKFQREINKEDIKISKNIQDIQDKLSRIEKIRRKEKRQYLFNLLLHSLILAAINTGITLVILRQIFSSQNKSNQARIASTDIKTIKNQIYNQLSQEFTVNDQFSRKINQLIQLFNNIETRIITLEQTTNYYPQTSSYSSTNRNYPSTPQTSLTKQITSLRSDNINFDQLAQSGIAEKYNLNAASLKSAAIPVLVTEESINNSVNVSQQKIILQRTRRGNYWIVNDGEVNYLVPESKFKINTFNSKTIVYLFECENYQESSSRNFSLIQPARVSVVTTDEVWQLEERGILQFE